MLSRRWNRTCFRLSLPYSVSWHILIRFESQSAEAIMLCRSEPYIQVPTLCWTTSLHPSLHAKCIPSSTSSSSAPIFIRRRPTLFALSLVSWFSIYPSRAIDPSDQASPIHKMKSFTLAALFTLLAFASAAPVPYDSEFPNLHGVRKEVYEAESNGSTRKRSRS